MSVLDRLLEGSRVLHALRVDPGGVVRHVNPALARSVGMAREQLEGMSVAALLKGEDRTRVAGWLGGAEIPTAPTRVRLETSRGHPLDLQVIVHRDDEGVLLLGEQQAPAEDEAAEELTQMNNELAALARERARRERALERMQRRTQAALDDLERSYWHLRKVQEVLSFCMECGRVADGDGSWRSFVDFLKENDILVSHAYCPDCADRFVEAYGLNGADGETTTGEGQAQDPGGSS